MSLSDAIGIVALAASAVAWYRTYRMERAHKALEARLLTLELADKEAAAERAKRAKLTVHVRKSGQTYQLIMVNEGLAEARSIGIQPHVAQDVVGPYWRFTAQLPLARLGAREERLVALIAWTNRTPTRYSLTLSWEDPDGAKQEAETEFDLRLSG
jgi:hypothetical protein